MMMKDDDDDIAKNKEVTIWVSSAAVNGTTPFAVLRAFFFEETIKKLKYLWIP
jgi:hypothetical protein